MICMERENMEKQKFHPPAVGGSSLLVIFAVLCLTVFALLSLGTVLAERRLADASAQAVTAYYGADAEAEIIFARLRNGELPENVLKTGNRYAYECAISDSRRLLVELEYRNGSWKVLRWQEVVRAPKFQGDSKNGD